MFHIVQLSQNGEVVVTHNPKIGKTDIYMVISYFINALQLKSSKMYYKYSARKKKDFIFLGQVYHP